MGRAWGKAGMTERIAARLRLRARGDSGFDQEQSGSPGDGARLWQVLRQWGRLAGVAPDASLNRVAGSGAPVVSVGTPMGHKPGKTGVMRLGVGAGAWRWGVSALIFFSIFALQACAASPSPKINDEVEIRRTLTAANFSRDGKYLTHAIKVPRNVAIAVKLNHECLERFQEDSILSKISFGMLSHDVPQLGVLSSLCHEPASRKLDSIEIDFSDNVHGIGSGISNDRGNKIFENETCTIYRSKSTRDKINPSPDDRISIVAVIFLFDQRINTKDREEQLNNVFYRSIKSTANSRARLCVTRAKAEYFGLFAVSRSASDSLIGKLKNFYITDIPKHCRRMLSIFNVSIEASNRMEALENTRKISKEQFFHNLAAHDQYKCIGKL